MMHPTRLLVLAGLALALGAQGVAAQRGGRGGGGRGGGGGGGMSRGGARTSVSRPSGGSFGGSRPAQMPSRPAPGMANRPANPISPGSPAGGIRPGNPGNAGGIRPGNPGIDRGQIGSGNRGDINVNRPVNIGDVDPGYGYDRGWGGCCYHPVAGAAVIAGTAALTAAAIGSVWYTLPPSCVSSYYNSYTYMNCDGTWVQPQFEGEETTYIVVNAPPGATTTPTTTPPTTTPPATPPTTPR